MPYTAMTTEEVVEIMTAASREIRERLYNYDITDLPREALYEGIAVSSMLMRVGYDLIQMGADAKLVLERSVL